LAPEKIFFSLLFSPYLLHCAALVWRDSCGCRGRRLISKKKHDVEKKALFSTFLLQASKWTGRSMCLLLKEYRGRTLQRGRRRKLRRSRGDGVDVWEIADEDVHFDIQNHGKRFSNAEFCLICQDVMV
jgi:hypothetical protein